MSVNTPTDPPKPSITREFFKQVYSLIARLYGFEDVAKDLQDHVLSQESTVKISRVLLSLLVTVLIALAGGFWIRGWVNDSGVSELKGQINIKDSTIQSQAATVAAQKQKLDDINFERDQSAAAVKKRAKMLSTNISEFISDFRKNYENQFGYKSVQDVGNELSRITSQYTNKDEGIRQFHLESSRKVHAALVYEDEQSAIFQNRFFSRLNTIRQQLSELGFQSPKSGALLANPHQSIRLSGLETARELQLLSDQIKE